MADSKHFFSVHPSVVYQLGESLISDSIQALMELVKNCYDADATFAKITIDTSGSVTVPDSIFPNSKSRIIIEDDGFGMDLETIENGWLKISNRTKLDMKKAKITTPGGRTPLGDKGLGRLGVQLLGNDIEIFTKKEGGSGYHLGFSWEDFATAPSLSDVDIHLGEIDFSRTKGTKVVISDLKNGSEWVGQKNTNDLQKELSRMISPFKQIRQFDVIVVINGSRLDLVGISEKVLSIAPIKYSLNFDGSNFAISGYAKLNYFRPSTSKREAEQFALIVESDAGQTFWKYLTKQKEASSFNLCKSDDGNWFISFSTVRMLENLDKVEILDCSNESEGIVANPGAFSGEIDAFDLGSLPVEHINVFDRLADYRNFVKDISGIKVYRDGFAIGREADKDWLGFSKQWTSARSYYGLKPENTIGYIALTARENIELEEVTNREGFKDSPYYRNFFLLLQQFVKFSTDVQTFLGRAWVGFVKMRNEELARIDSRKSIEDIAQTIKNTLSDAPSQKQRIISFQTRMKSSLDESKSVIKMLNDNPNITQSIREKVMILLQHLQSMIDESQSVMEQAKSYLSELSDMKDASQVLSDRVDSLRRQMDDMYETIALGLTAEALSHEIFNITDYLATRTKTAQTHVLNSKSADSTLIAYFEYIHSSIITLRKQMSYMSPALKYVRDKKDDIQVITFLNDLIHFYETRLKNNNILMRVEVKNEDRFKLHINKGKLAQIMDNLVLNSEYWLKESIAQKRVKSGLITIEIDKPFIRIFDNGSGIDEAVEGSLFEPFITTKSKGQGRGLGLFIIKQLLDSEGCSIGIVPERNERNRLFKFQLNFRGVINGK